MNYLLSVLVGILFLTGSLYGEAVKIQKPKRRPQLAAPAPMIVPTPKKDELVKFVQCNDEEECYRLLQDLDLPTAKEKGASFIAEFVESPKKGLMVYKKTAP